MLEAAFGTIAFLLSLSLYPAFLFQFRTVWRGNDRETITVSIDFFLFNLLRYICWVGYGLSKADLDEFLVLSRLPGVLVLPLLLYQYRSPRLSSFVFLSYSALVTSLGTLAIWKLELFLPFFRHLELFFAGASLVLFSLTVFFILPKQRKRFWNEGIKSSSLAFQFVYLAFNIGWMLYGIVSSDLVLKLCYVPASFIQGLIVRDLCKRGRSTRNQTDRETK